jgi:uncharacterized RDD family membrane protein YckC
MALDSLIEAGVYIILSVVFVSTIAVFPSANAGVWFAAIFIFLAFSVYWGYFAFFEAVWKGQTPGKRIIKIRVIKDTGRPINVFESLARNLMRVIDWLPFLYGAGVLTMILNGKNRRLGDFVAGTVVVHERGRESRIQPDWSNLEVEAATVTAVSGLDAQDLELIETFLARRYDLDPAVRYSTADQIAAHIAAKTNVQREPGTGVETYLEQVARGLRDHARFSEPR